MKTKAQRSLSVSVLGIDQSSVDFQGRLLTEDEAAAFLNVAVRTIQGWRVRGGGPRFCRYSSRAVRYRQSDLVAFVEARCVSSTSDRGGAAV